jgi:hypothetical protein
MILRSTAIFIYSAPRNWAVINDLRLEMRLEKYLMEIMKMREAAK